MADDPFNTFEEKIAADEVAKALSTIAPESRRAALEKLRGVYGAAPAEGMRPYSVQSDKQDMDELRRLALDEPEPARVTLTAPDGKVLLDSNKPAEIDIAIRQWRGALSGQQLKSARKQFSSLRKDTGAEIKDLEEKRAVQLDRLEALDRARNAWAEWGLKPYRLEKPQGSLSHKVVEALEAGNFTCTKSAQAILDEQDFDGVSFLVEHDWASAFSGADGLEGDEFPLPFENTIFEFQITGVPTLVCATETFWLVFARFHGHWLVQTRDDEDDLDNKFWSLIEKQIRAVCIAMDAEVAIKETIRAPEKLNRQREQRGRRPLADYHVVKLNRRPRAAPLDRDPLTEPTHHRRMHFVRGHWRHYQEHKTWIKWHLRGDPDLGFIDKHYRL